MFTTSKYDSEILKLIFNEGKLHAETINCNATKNGGNYQFNGKHEQLLLLLLLGLSTLITQ